MIVARISITALLCAVGICVFADVAHADPFTHDPPGVLAPKSGSGRTGDSTIYAPGIRFPLEAGPAFANSQVYGHGGGSGPGGSQCDIENFSYPWHDVYCETRDWDMPLCPAGQGHQGQDVRAASCDKGKYWAVAVVDGTITSVGSYSVYLTAADGTRFDYLHMQDVAVKEGDVVKRAQHMGKVSNQFGGSATTVHLHFNIRQNVAGIGDVFVPPYSTLIDSYEDLLGLHPAAPDAGVDASVDEPSTPAPPASSPPKQTTSAPLPPAADEPAAPQSNGESGCSSSNGSSSPLSSMSGVGFGLVVIAALLGRRRRRKLS